MAKLLSARESRSALPFAQSFLRTLCSSCPPARTWFPSWRERGARPNIPSTFLGDGENTPADAIPTIILCDTAGQAERLDELLNDDRVSPATLAIGVLDGGFVIPPSGESFEGYRVLTDHEMFRRERRFRRARRYAAGSALETLTALKPGDYVVHLEHGGGVYRGRGRG